MSGLVALADAVHLENRPLPKAPDGRYDYQVQPKTASDQSADATHSYLYKAVNYVEGAHKRIKSFNPSLIPAFAQAVRSPDAVDDRSGLFTNGLAYLCSLPQGSILEKKLNDDAISLLYNSLPHPPATFLGTPAPLSPTPVPAKSAEDWGSGAVQTQAAPTNGHAAAPSPPIGQGATLAAPAGPAPQLPFAFRSADGSGNNVLLPNLGKAGMPYARSVQNKRPLPPHTLPDPGAIFDSLLAARDWKPHPGGNSSLTFAFASLVTHMLFRTNRRDPTINDTSSYLDLSILYGINQAQQDTVRDKSLGRGYLYPDCFAEDRLVLVPPASTALLVIFSRNHNYICDMLLKINERKRWMDPSLVQDPAKLAQQDEEIFQTARLVNCGHFMAMIFGDYVAGFLGLGRDGNSWTMNPFDPIKNSDGMPVTRGEGNHCSVEFNLLYRWHATTAEQDVGWTQDLFAKLFVNQPIATATLKDFGPAVVKAWNDFVDPNPRTRTFSNLKRGPDGKFSDDDLARVLQDATENPAGSYRARGTPEILRLVEILGIQQGRQWGVCTMNEFRKFLGLKPFADFEDWSTDAAVVTAARQLYGHIDNLELYPGLQAEDCMPLGPGSGICCGYTMTRAILGDAIALVRGDRFYTTDYTPNNLTAWGFQDCARDPGNGAFGAALPKLLFRHLSRHYPANSAYALFPFFTPPTTKQNLTKLGVVAKYDFARPKPQPVPKVVDTIAGIRYVFADYKKFKTTYGDDMRMLTGGYGFFLVFDEQDKHEKDRALALHALFPEKDSLAHYKEFYKNTTRQMIKDYSYKIAGLPGTRVDIVRNVINLVSVHWVADYLFGISLKTAANPKGMFTEQEVYDMFSVLFTCVFINVQPEHGWALREGASQVGGVVNALIQKSLNEVAPGTSSNIFSGFVNAVSSLLWPVKKPYHTFLGKLAESGRPTRELVAEVIGLAVGSSVNYAQAAAQVVDFYLDGARAKERAEIQRLVQKTDAESAELLRGYVREAQRLNPQFAGLLRVAVQADSIPVGHGKPNVDVVPGDIIFSSYRNAHLNTDDFPNPLTVDPRRPKDRYQVQGAGFHGCPGVNFAEQTIPEILKVVFSLKNIRRAEGAAGNMAKFMLNVLGTDNLTYLDNTGNPTPWPGSLTVIYDA